MATPAAIAVGILLNFAGPVPPVDTLLVEERFFGAFERAYRITLDARGRVFVLDRGASSVRVFSPRFELLQEIGGFGWAAASFDHPTAIATDGLTVYVADYGNHRISRFNQPLTHLSTLFTRDTSYTPARFGFPEGVTLSRQGDLYVLDGENLRIVKFDSRSNFEYSFGGYESGAGKLTKPIEVLSSSFDRLYVLEPGRVVEFDYTGNYVTTIGTGILADARGFCETPDGIAVVSSEYVWMFDRVGALVHTIQVSSILSEAFVDLSDVAISHDRMFLLGRHSAGVFRILDDGQ